jgi:hypothetical protein
MKQALERFFQSPENRTGLAIWLGTAVTAAVQYFWAHQELSSVDSLGLVLGLIKIAQPENCVTVAQLEKAIGDVSALLKTGNSAAAGAVVADVEEVVAGVVQAAPKSC